MATALRATVKFPSVTGFERDTAENVLHFAHTTPSTTPPGDSIAYFTPLIEAFFNTAVAPNTVPVGAFMAESIDRAHCEIEWAGVDMVTDKVTPAITHSPFTLVAFTGPQPLPLEVAVCCSVKSNQDAGTVVARRRRGRVYIGPLQDSALVQGAGPALPAVNPILQATLVASAKELARVGDWNVGADAPAGVGSWAIYSRMAHTAFAIDEGFVDNEFDTQRRRGYRALVRSSWLIT